ncbi:hypothetical protein PENFLA_c023G07469 [Penicillium flavigenum]|uniref:Branched-chain-amino-acid aminotransferase n=1 Tax=Penicillium flavigenum TaxID=254877 RepID=A0A1V6SV51_9EURO|nr:hypothetical protein PENFLA_c023G07469 [Penicillium flavigenum]
MEKIFAAYHERQKVLAANTHPFAKGVAWVEGELTPLHEARIPILDQGFMHSDLTYDVPSVWDGRFFRLDDHITRLEASCTKLRMKPPPTRRGEADSGRYGCVRGSRPEDIVNRIYMFIQPYVWCMEPEVQPVGGSAIIARTVRRVPPGCIDPTVKNLQWGDLVRGLFEASDRGAEYPFLTDGDTNLTEGSGFNIVLVKDNILYTPARGVLEGVTRKSVIDVARASGFDIEIELVPVQMAYDADEIFMCTTAGGIMPITSLDGKPVKDGKVGSVTKKIWDGYWAIHYDPAYSFELAY